MVIIILFLCLLFSIPVSASPPDFYINGYPADHLEKYREYLEKRLPDGSEEEGKINLLAVVEEVIWREGKLNGASPPSVPVFFAGEKCSFCCLPEGAEGLVLFDEQNRPLLVDMYPPWLRGRVIDVCQEKGLIKIKRGEEKISIPAGSKELDQIQKGSWVRFWQKEHKILLQPL